MDILQKSYLPQSSQRKKRLKSFSSIVSACSAAAFARGLMKRYKVQLSKEERTGLQKLLSAGEAPVRKLTRAGRLTQNKPWNSQIIKTNSWISRQKILNCISPGKSKLLPITCYVMLRGGFCPEASLKGCARDPSVAKTALPQGDTTFYYPGSNLS